VFIAQLNLFSDTREENIDLFILLDKSLSMEEENKIKSVNEYVCQFIIDEIIIPGDMLYIINFYGKTDVFINSAVKDENHKEEIKRNVMKIKADGKFTDIGNALDNLASTTAGYEDNGRLKYMLLITDGRQEAPPGSVYQWPLGKPFNHKFLEHTRTIEKKGWKIHILGIGKHTDAKVLAEKLSATYSVVETQQESRGTLATPPGEASSASANTSLVDNLISQTPDFLSVVKVVSGPNISYKGFLQKPYIEFETEASYLNSVKEIGLSSIIFTDKHNQKAGDIIENVVDISFIENGVKKIRIPAILPDDLPSGKVDGEIRFIYGNQNVLTPSLFDISFTNKNIFSRFMVHFIILAILLLALLLLVANSMIPGSKTSGVPSAAKSAAPVKNAISEGLSFFFYLNGRKLQELPLILKNKEHFFLNLSPAGLVDITETKNEFTKAMLTAKGKILSMEVFDKSLLADKKQKFDNILERSFNFLKQNGKDLIISFRKK